MEKQELNELEKDLKAAGGVVTLFDCSGRHVASFDTVKEAYNYIADNWDALTDSNDLETVAEVPNSTPLPFGGGRWIRDDELTDRVNDYILYNI